MYNEKGDEKMLKREIYLRKIRPFYNSNLIKILVGIRRCGKSILLKQIIEELKRSNISKDHIIYINFEYIEYEELLDYKKLNKFIKDKIKDDKTYYLFFDEIQNVPQFEKVINSLRASSNVSIFITGSNSKLLASELSTVLSGRYVTFKIKPLCYKEVTQLLNINEEVLEDYLKWGGLPNRFEFNDEESIKNYLYNVYDSIILRDIVERLKLQDINLFNLILQYIIDTIGREFSSTNIIKYLKNEGREISNSTLYSYLDALCKCFLIQKIYRYDVHGKAILKTLNKYYLTDLGLAQIKNNKSFINKSYAIENIVYNQLLTFGYDVCIGKTKKGEIDFVAMRANEIKYIQVSLTVSDENTYERELSAFDEIKDNYPKYLITLDKLDYSKNGIIHLNLIDFLNKEEF